MSEPRRYVQGTPILSGEVFITVSGRHADPAPKLDYSTDRKAINSERRWHGWMIEQAVAEAESRGRDDLAAAWRNEKPTNLPPASFDCMWSYTFEDETTVELDKRFSPILKRLT